MCDIPIIRKKGHASRIVGNGNDRNRYPSTWSRYHEVQKQEASGGILDVLTLRNDPIRVDGMFVRTFRISHPRKS